MNKNVKKVIDRSSRSISLNFLDDKELQSPFDK